jgi:hypothetical protein
MATPPAFFPVLPRNQWQKNTSLCQLCNVSFGTLGNRPHHCRSCGACVCAGCAPEMERPLAHGLVKTRICKRCVATELKPSTNAVEDATQRAQLHPQSDDPAHLDFFQALAAPSSGGSGGAHALSNSCDHLQLYGISASNASTDLQLDMSPRGYFGHNGGVTPRYDGNASISAGAKAAPFHAAEAEGTGRPTLTVGIPPLQADVLAGFGQVSPLSVTSGVRGARTSSQGTASPYATASGPNASGGGTGSGGGGGGPSGPGSGSGSGGAHYYGYPSTSASPHHMVSSRGSSTASGTPASSFGSNFESGAANGHSGSLSARGSGTVSGSGTSSGTGNQPMQGLMTPSASFTARACLNCGKNFFARPISASTVPSRDSSGRVTPSASFLTLPADSPVSASGPGSGSGAVPVGNAASTTFDILAAAHGGMHSARYGPGAFSPFGNGTGNGSGQGGSGGGGGGGCGPAQLEAQMCSRDCFTTYSLNSGHSSVLITR